MLHPPGGGGGGEWRERRTEIRLRSQPRVETQYLFFSVPVQSLTQSALTHVSG